MALAHLFSILWLALLVFAATTSAKRSFTIDYEKNEFLLDGKPFRYVSGEMHYFRVPHQLWRDRLRKMKYGGLNVVQTYIEWSSIETKPGVYDFSGNNNITRFITEAQEEGLLVIVRPGYICAERDMGGLPSWLLKQNPNIKLRSSNAQYLTALDRWLKVLFQVIKPLLYTNGGPIIMVQVENEYGSYERSTCDTNYTSHLREMFRRLLPDTVLFTTDGNGHTYFRCGKIANVFATIDFGIMNRTDLNKAFGILRRYQPNGPLVNSEYYSGWLDYWSRAHQTRPVAEFSDTLDGMLQMNASVNIYMYHGGTNFGFSAGANMDPVFYPVPTSYDYDAPISEAGDLTAKFYAIKQVIQKYMPVTDFNFKIPSFSEKMQLEPIDMKYKASIFDVLPEPITSKLPQSFEQLDHAYGFMLYSINITFQTSDPAVLHIPNLHDRAQVFVDKEFAGTLSVTRKVLQLPIHAANGSTIDVLVENQGRIFYGQLINQRKGILPPVNLSDHVLTQWRHYKIFSNWGTALSKVNCTCASSSPQRRIPAFYSGQFKLPNISSYPLDSFLQVDGWSKGVAFLNGHNLGRYWPVEGPQVTLYAPSVFFKPFPQVNEIVLFELEQSPCLTKGKCSVQFVNTHIIDGTVPTQATKKKHTFVQLGG